MWGKRWWKNRFRSCRPVIGFIERGLNPVLFDVRNQGRLRDQPASLPGSIRLAPEEADKAPINIEPTQMIVTYCTSPEEATSERVAAVLRKRGYKHVRILKGGLGGWTMPGCRSRGIGAAVDRLEIYKNCRWATSSGGRSSAATFIFKEGDDARDEASSPLRNRRNPPELRRRGEGLEPDREVSPSARSGSSARDALGDRRRAETSSSS